MWRELDPTPRTAAGGPMRGSPRPGRGSAAGEVDRLVAGWRGPRTGGTCVVDGVQLVEVMFLARVPRARAVLLHLSGLTDRHRENLGPSLLEPTAAEGVFEGRFMLPADSILCYRFTDVTDLPDDIGTTREGWREIHRRGEPDPANPRRMRTPLCGDSSLWVGPQARWTTWPESEVEGWVEVAGGRRCRVLPGDERVVVCLDGQFLDGLGLGAGVRAAGLGHTLVTVDCGLGDDRAAALTSVEGARPVVEHALSAATEVLGYEVDRAWAVAGQSYGGLAVGWLLSSCPDLVERGIAQSGSFWHTRSEGVDMDRPGDLVRLLRAGHGDVTHPVAVQVGAEEDQMVQQSRWYRDALAQRGAQVTHLEVRGGHDYAWWRHGLVEALARWE